MTDDDLIRMIRDIDTPPDWAQVRARLEREWEKSTRAMLIHVARIKRRH